jgi:protein-S-isoprenylcysteine O-methyltransferase Ste14
MSHPRRSGPLSWLPTPKYGPVSPGDNGDTSVSLHRWIIAGMWLLFIAYWAVAGARAKPSVSPSKRRLRWEIGLRLVVILLIAALLQSRSIRQLIAETQRTVSHSRVLGWTGVALCLLGFALAISARRHLGRNWGLPMSRKEQSALVTNGPYALIRHPIYAGLILAMVGSAIGVHVFGALMLAFAGPYFIYSARREEAVMLQLFPEQYSVYRARTGMFAPCPFRRG